MLFLDQVLADLMLPAFRVDFPLDVDFTAMEESCLILPSDVCPTVHVFDCGLESVGRCAAEHSLTVSVALASDHGWSEST